MSDIVYVLTNPSMPRYVKIGRTTNLKSRMRNLNTGAREPFECAIAVDVAPLEARRIERALHKAFNPDQTASSREYFKMDPERVVAILREWPGKNVTPPTADTKPKTKTKNKPARTTNTKTTPTTKKRPPLNFAEMGIPVGSTLVCRKTGEEAVVIGDKKVRFRGEDTSLTAATRIILGYTTHPTPHWTYQHQTLQELHTQTYGPRDE